MKVIVVGCGQVGTALVSQLLMMGHQVTVIDQDKSAFDDLPVDFLGRTIEGDVLDREVLHRAEFAAADALVAVTDSDTLNALIAHIARTEYHISRTVVGNADPRQRPLQEIFDSPVIGSASWGAQRMLELVSDPELRPVLSDCKDDYMVYQLEVSVKWHGRSLQDLLAEDFQKVLGVTRSGQPLTVSKDRTVDAGDLIYLSVHQNEIELLRSRLGLKKEPRS